MKSQNHLTITGTIATDVLVAHRRQFGRFTITHNFSSSRLPLYLGCVFFGKAFGRVRLQHPHKGDEVLLTAYLRPCFSGIEAVIKDLEVYKGVAFDHVDTGRQYVIPPRKCNADDCRVEDKVLILSTGEEVTFQTEEAAKAVWCHLDECFRKGFHHLFFQEATMAYGMD